MNKVRIAALAQLREWLAQQPVILDTETTGLDDMVQVCDVAVIDMKGNVLLDTLVRPTVPIPAEARAVHGITDEAVSGAPAFADLLPALKGVLTGQTVITYNAEYDLRLLRQSAAANGLDWDSEAPASWRCAMKLFSRYKTEWVAARQSYRWHKLCDAARQCGVSLYGLRLHRALADVETTRRVLLAMIGEIESGNGDKDRGAGNG